MGLLRLPLPLCKLNSAEHVIDDFRMQQLADERRREALLDQVRGRHYGVGPRPQNSTPLRRGSNASRRSSVGSHCGPPLLETPEAQEAMAVQQQRMLRLPNIGDPRAMGRAAVYARASLRG